MSMSMLMTRGRSVSIRVDVRLVSSRVDADVVVGGSSSCLVSMPMALFASGLSLPVGVRGVDGTTYEWSRCCGVDGTTHEWSRCVSLMVMIQVDLVVELISLSS